MYDKISRRELMKGGGMVAIGLMAPPWLSAIAKADMLRLNRGENISPDNVLVVCQFSGGNDGLNMVVPWANKAYYDLRPTLAIPEKDVLHLNDAMGFHPAMTGMQTLFKEGKVAVIQGVGYPNPNRSHFKSMEIWQSASPQTTLKNGWIGRHMDIMAEREQLAAVYGIGLSTEKPRALAASKASIPCFASLQDISSIVGDPAVEKMLRDIQGTEAAAGSDTLYVQQANKAALDAMAALQTKLSTYKSTSTYGSNPFGNGFKQIAQLIATSPQTRVIYFSAGGFDTHARQADNHKNLLQNFSDAMLTFQREMEAIGKADKVITMVFSEFGRRTYENASGGTDHGAAGPMMLVGKKVKGGFHGPNPDLLDLNDGDQKFNTDFRQVYATALDNWMGGESEKVLAEKFSTLPLI